MKKTQKLIEIYKQNKKSSIIVYLIVRIIIIGCLIRQIIAGDINNAFLCGLSLILLTLPFFISKKFKIEIPNLFEVIIIIFIFAAEILGEINNFYRVIPFWDSLLHTLNGFLCAGIGFSLVNLLNENSHRLKLSPFYIAIVAFCFSMTIGVLWEFFEFAGDKIMLTDMQKDQITTQISSVNLHEEGKNKQVIIKNIDKTIILDKDGNELAIIDGGYLDIGLNDTMSDLLVNFIGAISFSILGYVYLKVGKFTFTQNFVVKRVEKEK